MKPLSSLMLLALLLPPWVLAAAGGRQAPGLASGSGGDAARAAPAACESSQEEQKVKPGSESPWISAYVPLRSCHRVLQEEHGEFSPPAYHGDLPRSFWCNWTIRAGSRKHIIIYILGFSSQQGCHSSGDKILFEGVSSLVGHSVVYACWQKETHVFATLAQAVHVLLLRRASPSCRGAQFKGKYHIFHDQEGEASSQGDVTPGTPAPELPRQDGTFQSEHLRDVLSSATPHSSAGLGQPAVLSSATPHSSAGLGQPAVLSSATPHSSAGLGQPAVLGRESLWHRGILPGAEAVGSPAEAVPREAVKPSRVESEAPCVLGSELPGGLRSCQGAEGRAEHTLPAAAQESHGQRLSPGRGTGPGLGRSHSLSHVLLATPLPSAWPAAELWGLEGWQSALPPAPGLPAVSDLRLAIQPTPTGRLGSAAPWQPLVPAGRGSRGSTDATGCQGLGTLSLEKEESRSLPGRAGTASSLAEALLPSMSSPHAVAPRDPSRPLPPRCPSSSGGSAMTQPGPGAPGLQHTNLLAAASPEVSRGAAEEKAVLHATVPGGTLPGHPHWHSQSSHSLQPASTAPGSLPQSAQGSPPAEAAQAAPVGVRSCLQQSARAAAGLAEPSLPTGLRPPPRAVPAPGTGAVPAVPVSCTGPDPADFDPADFTLPSAVEPASSLVCSPPAPVGTASLGARAGPLLASAGGQEVISPAPPCHPPAALDLDTTSLRPRAGTLLASAGVISPSPPCQPAVAPEPGTTEAPGCLGHRVHELPLGQVGGQQGETPALVGSQAGGPSPGPKPGVGLPQPEDHASSGSGVAPASLPGTWGERQEEHAVPGQHWGTAAHGKPTSAPILGGLHLHKTTEAPQVGAGEQRNASASATPAQPGPAVAQGQTVWNGQMPPDSSDGPASRSPQMPGGQQQKHAGLGAPWAVQYSPARSCHLVLGDGSGTFSLPPRAEAQANIWCNWTVLGGPQKHLLVYIQGFQGSESCARNQDKIIFQGVLSRVETQVVYACHNRGTLIFATQAAALHILLLASLHGQYGHFKGHYYVFRDSGTRGLSKGAMVPQEPVQEASKRASWRMAITKDWLPMVRASLGPPHAPAGGKVQPELVSPTGEAQHPPDLLESAQSGASLSRLELEECGQLQDKRELGRSPEDSGSEAAEGDALVGLSPAHRGAEVSAPGPAEAELVSAELVSALLAWCPPGSVPSPEVPSSTADVSATAPGLGEASASLLDEEVASAAPGTQAPVLEEPLLTRSTKPAPLSPSPAVTAGGEMSAGEGPEELLDLVSALASLENSTELQAQHHPGDVLFEVTAEIKPQGWIPPGGRELQQGLLESMKSYIQQNLKLPAKRVSEIKLKEIKRAGGANLLLRLWLQLKPEDRNLSALLLSRLRQLPATGAGPAGPQLVSLLVEDVDECGAGPSLCGEQAECFNRPGTYLCRCREGYEDHSPTKSGTSCVPAPRPGTGFLQYADILVGASLMAALAMLVAAGAMCRRRWSCRRSPSPEEPAGRAEEEPALELPALGECLRLDPFQLKLRARTPEWLWGARTSPGQVCQLYLEQSPPL